MEKFDVAIEGRLCDEIPYYMKKPRYIGINVIVNGKKILDRIRLKDVCDSLTEIKNDYPDHVMKLIIDSIGPVSEFMTEEVKFMKERENANGI